MKAIEFETELTDNTIHIPESFREELSLSKDKHVRIIVLIDNAHEETEFKNALNKHFLNGYDEVDAIYDNL